MAPVSNNDPRAAQHWDPQRYNKNAGFVAELGSPLLDLLQPQPGERILDLGCGEGALTEKLVSAGAAVVGVDASPDQVAAARRRGLDAQVVDGEALTFDREFDAVLSNAALHWMLNPAAVLHGVARALKPGGRFVGEMGGAGNVAIITRAVSQALEARGIDSRAANPWYFPTPEEYGSRLKEAGFEVASIQLIPRPTPLPGEIAGWLETFCESFIKKVPEADVAAFMAEVTAALRPELCDAEGKWTADYVRLRFVARLVA
ncbi:MAG: methyltransferase domain-containing protein [Kiloniellaceae bacterium]